MTVVQVSEPNEGW